MENIKKTGIYSIINTKNNKKYIGSTSQSFKKRFEHHISLLRARKHKNAHLQHAWNKYGEKSFIFDIECICCENILEKEQEILDSYDFEDLYNINPYATGGLQFSQESIEKRVKTFTKVIRERAQKYKLWKKGVVSDKDLSEEEISQFESWQKKPWNKGMKYESTDHFKVPKKVRGDRTKDKETKRNKLPEIEVYTQEGVFLKSFRSAKDLEEWSVTEDNDLPIKSRFSVERMGKPVKMLQSVNINKSARTGKPYKGLIFKFKQSPSNK